jgi:hypothetical protein
VGVGLAPGDQAAVPGQQRGRGDDPMLTQVPGEHAGQGGQDRPCTVPKLDAGLVARCFSGELSSSSVLVDHSAEDAMTPDRGVEQSHRGGVVQWWALVEALVWAVVIEMAHILVEDGAGVSLVVDQ